MVMPPGRRITLHDPAMFIETDDGYALLAQKCRDCGKIAFPRKRVCPTCFSDHLTEQVLSRTGVLHTFTCTYVGAPHLPSPYLLGFVDVPEGVRLLSLLVDCDPWEDVLQVGMPMEMVLDPLMDDRYTYKFRPVVGERP